MIINLLEVFMIEPGLDSRNFEFVFMDKTFETSTSPNNKLSHTAKIFQSPVFLPNYSKNINHPPPRFNRSNQLSVTTMATRFYSLMKNGLPPKLNARSILSSVTEARRGQVTKDHITSMSSTPLMAPSYPAGPYSFTDREYFIVAYETDYDKIAQCVPAPLKPKSNLVLYEWINMDSTGLGFYKESGTVIPCILPDGKEVNYTLQMFLDCEPPIAAGREIWGFPKKYANPTFEVHRDTVVGTLDYAGQRVATGTMAYKYKRIVDQVAIDSLTKTSVNLKMIPDVNFNCKIAQLVQYNLRDVVLKFAYEGPARLDLIPHINAPTAHLPIRRVIGGKHIKADITLPYGSVLHDYLDPGTEQPTEEEGRLNRSQILSNPVMPVTAPSFKATSSNMNDRDYFIVRYRTTPGALQQLVPDMFFVNEQDEVVIQWVQTKATGIGDYSKVDVYVPVTDSYGNSFNFALVSFLNSSAPITFGREIYGMPQKYAQNVESIVHRDTITGVLDYSNSRVATATMQFKHKKMPVEMAVDYLSRNTINMKVIPDVDGKTLVAQLVEVDFSNIIVKEAYEGPAAIDLIPHVHAPLADLPVLKVLGGYSIKCDVMMHKGKVYYDYLRQ